MLPRSFGRIIAVGSLFLKAPVPGVDDELASFVGARFLNAGFDGCFFGREGCEALFALALQVPALAPGGYDVITDPAALFGP